MIERLADMPAGTLGFRAVGEIEREDYDELLVPELRRAIESAAGGGALVASGGVAAAKAVYDDLTAQLGATEQDLAETEQELDDANADAPRRDGVSPALEGRPAPAPTP